VLEGHGFASTRSTGDQAMAIGQAHGLLDWLTAWVSTYNYGRSIRHLSHPPLKLWLNSADTTG